MSSSSPSQNQKTLDLTLKALNSFEIDALASLIDDKFTQHFFPGSLTGMGGGHFPEVRNRQEYLDHMASLKGMFAGGGFNLGVVDKVEGSDAIVVHLKSNGSMANGKPYTNEYVITLRFNDEGKIVSMREFMDSAYMLSILPKTQ